MASQIESAETAHGSVVAFEGDANLIGTQLRLLPISSKILIINSLLDAIPQFSTTASFDARSFVRHVHRVFSDRTETARTFLKSSTSEQPRLVFMNGGSVCARAACLEKICEKVTNGNLAEAEIVFEDIVKGGVTGLMNANDDPQEIGDKEVAKMEHISSEMDVEKHKAKKQRMSEDPSIVAMRAAETLDRATASLQPSIEVEEAVSDASTFRTSLISSVMEIRWSPTRSATNKCHSDSASEQSRGRTLTRGALRNRRNVRKRFSSLDSSLFSVDLEHSIFDAVQSTLSPTTSNPQNKRGTFGNTSFKLYAHMTRYSESTLAPESMKDRNSLLQPESAKEPYSIPPTPVILEFGEAYVVEVQPKIPKRVKSVDRIYASGDYSQETALSSPRSLNLKHSLSSICLGDRSSDLATLPRSDSPKSVRSQPRTITVKAAKTIIYRNPVAINMASDKRNKRNMVDRGCSPIRWDGTPVASAHENAGSQDTSEPVPVQPVFPAVEDLIIHVDDGKKNDILQAVIKGYKNGVYPTTTAASSQPIAKSPSSVSIAISLQHKTPKSTTQPNSTTATTSKAEDSSADHNSTSSHHKVVDPFHPDSYPMHPPRIWTLPSEKDFTQITSNASPPTPATTPPPTTTTTTTTTTMDTNPARKFHDFAATNSNAVEMQNSLRTTLKSHFPPEANYRQYPISVKHDRFWKPVFRSDDGNGSEGRTMDQIIALGCDESVDRSLLAEVTGKIEALGMKPNGANRTGRLDIRYLIAAAMQTFTSLPLTSQTSNPFTSPSKLSILLVPHLETYLSTNPTLRFLILTFPSTHLTTLLCLRKLVGSTNLKVATIVNAPASFPQRSSSRPSTPNVLSNEATLALNARRLPLSRLGTQKAQALLGNAPLPQPLSPPRYAPKDASTADDATRYGKADFVLTVSDGAAEMENSVSVFVGAIQKVLVEKNAFYAAAPVTPPMSGGCRRSRTLLKPLNTKAASALAAANLGRQRGQSQGQSFESMGLNRGEQNQRQEEWGRYYEMGSEFEEMKIGGAGKEKGGWGSEEELEDEEEEELEGERGDALEKMFMPRRAGVVGERGRNSRKALKLLGLA